MVAHPCGRHPFEPQFPFPESRCDNTLIQGFGEDEGARCVSGVISGCLASLATFLALQVRWVPWFDLGL